MRREPTTEELKLAYRDTGLAFLGISFERAMAVKAIRVSLACRVQGWRRIEAQHGKPAPIQPGLI